MEYSILHDESWIPYLNGADTHLSEYSNRYILKYPQNLIFTAQFLMQHLQDAKANIYNGHYPFAEKFDTRSLNSVDWQKTILVFDAQSYNLVAAPEPLKILSNLDRRLRYHQAREHIFDGFRIFPSIFELFTLHWVIFFYVLALIFLHRNKIPRFYTRYFPGRA